MFLMYAVTAALIGPLVFILTGRWTRRRRLLLALVAIVFLWVAETALFIAIGDETPPGSRTIDPRDVR